MKTLDELVDNIFIRLMSTMTRQEIKSLLIEASTQAFVKGFCDGNDYYFDNEDKRAEQYIKEINT